MDIHVVRPGDTLYELAYQYGVPMSRLIQDNQLPDPSQLVVGQTLVIQYPRCFPSPGTPGSRCGSCCATTPAWRGATGSTPDRSWSSPISRKNRACSP